MRGVSIYDVLGVVVLGALMLVRHGGRRVSCGIGRPGVVAKKLRSWGRDGPAVGLGILGESLAVLGGVTPALRLQVRLTTARLIACGLTAEWALAGCCGSHHAKPPRRRPYARLAPIGLRLVWPA